MPRETITRVATTIGTTMSQTPRPRPFSRELGNIVALPETCGAVRALMSTGDKTPAEVFHLQVEEAEEHVHKINCEYYFILAGSGCIVLNGVAHRLRAGTAVYIPPGIWHKAVEDADGMEALVVCAPSRSFPEFFGNNWAHVYELNEATEPEPAPDGIRVMRYYDETRIARSNLARCYYVLAGGGSLRFEDEVVNLRPGILVYVPIGWEHLLVPSQDNELRILAVNLVSEEPTIGLMNGDIHLRGGALGGFKGEF